MRSSRFWIEFEAARGALKLSGLQRRALDRLADAGGSYVPTATLQIAVWGKPRSRFALPHVLNAVSAKLRRHGFAIHTLARGGSALVRWTEGAGPAPVEPAARGLAPDIAGRWDEDEWVAV